jgi:molybdopterin-guanine dinucleotide biosynthesis protein A
MSMAAAVIAGGRSTRMGRDKARLPVPGHASLLARQLAVLDEALRAGERLVSCRPEQWLEIAGDVRAVFDDGAAGPLGGIVEVLRALRGDAVFLLGVDLGCMSAATIRLIAAQADVANGVGVVPMVNDRAEPLAAVLPRGLLALAERQLAAGRDLSLRTLAREGVAAGLLRCWQVPEGEVAQYANWNRPEDVPPAGG